MDSECAFSVQTMAPLTQVSVVSPLKDPSESTAEPLRSTRADQSSQKAKQKERRVCVGLAFREIAGLSRRRGNTFRE